MPEPPVRVHAIVRGRVQQVGFRAFVLHHAERLRVGGSVENLPDGSLACAVEGPRLAVDELIALLRRGPSAARVDDVSVREERPTGSSARMQVGGGAW